MKCVFGGKVSPREPGLLVTLAGNGIKSLSDLARHAKANPGKVNFAAAETNSLPHLAGEMLSKAGGLNLFVVPYAGLPWASDGSQILQFGNFW